MAMSTSTLTPCNCPMTPDGSSLAMGSYWVSRLHCFLCGPVVVLFLSECHITTFGWSEVHSTMVWWSCSGQAVVWMSPSGLWSEDVIRPSGLAERGGWGVLPGYGLWLTDQRESHSLGNWGSHRWEGRGRRVCQVTFYFICHMVRKQQM